MRKKLSGFTTILNVMAFSLIILSLVNIVVYEFKTNRTLQDNNQSIKDRENITTDSDKASSLRDIYYIILDGYAGSGTLKKVYDYDNKRFTDALIKKGFYIPFKSQSNYSLTFLSIASSLNMKYINNLTDLIGIESQDRRIPYKMIRDSEVMKFLKQKGYKFINFNSGWGPSHNNGFADLNIESALVNEFLLIFIQSTVLSAFENYFGIIKTDDRKRVLGTFSKLSEVHKIEEPVFAFAHIVSPHPPFLFGSNGETLQDAELKMKGSVWEQKENYLNQLNYISKKVETLIDEILSKKGDPPIIILQADHGPASTFGGKDSNWKNPTERMIRERMGIFNAYYLPKKEECPLYDSITPVNTFRLIFNNYFHGNYPLLNDELYFSNYINPYKFTNVTDSEQVSMRTALKFKGKK